jgi:hypothetical protein
MAGPTGPARGRPEDKLESPAIRVDLRDKPGDDETKKRPGEVMCLEE